MFKKIILTMTLSALCVQPLTAATWTWNYSGLSAWSNSSYWTPNSVPGTGMYDEAQINNGGGAYISGTTNAGQVILGTLAGQSGGLRVSGTNTSLNPYMLTVGYDGSGSVAVENGGKVNSFADIFIARDPGSTGTVTVTGSGSQLNNSNNYLRVGEWGEGTLFLLNRGTATSGNDIYIGSNGDALATGNGKVYVDGSGSELKNTAGIIYVGQYGTGLLNVTNGGTATAQNTVEIGTRPYNFGQSGTVIVGAGSTLQTTTGRVNVGTTAEKGVLGGTGTVIAAGGAEGVWVGGTNGGIPYKGVLSPGDYAGHIGTLGIQGALVMGDGTTFQLDYDESSNDMVTTTLNAWIVAGGGNLNISLSTFMRGDIMSPRTIIQAGTFLNYAAASVTLQLNGVDLTGSRASGSVTLQNTGTALQITSLHLEGYDNKSMTWTGAVNGDWDISTGNWTDDGDEVTFNTSVDATIVGLQKTVAKMTANNTRDLKIDGNIFGTGELTTLIGKDGSLTKQGTGSLTLDGINRFEGDISLNRGTTIVRRGWMLETPQELFVGNTSTGTLDIIEAGRVTVGGTTHIG